MCVFNHTRLLPAGSFEGRAGLPGGKTFHSLWTDFQSSVTPHQARFQETRLRKAVGEIFQRHPVWDRHSFLIWNIRALKIGSGGVLSCVTYGTSGANVSRPLADPPLPRASVSMFRVPTRADSRQGAHTPSRHDAPPRRWGRKRGRGGWRGRGDCPSPRPTDGREAECGRADVHCLNTGFTLSYQ